MSESDDTHSIVWRYIRYGLLGVGLVTAAGMYGCPQYNVWEQGLAGQAALERARQDRQIQVEEAQAQLDAANLLNQAEVARARGLAEASELVIETFGGPQNYLRYLWIQGIGGNQADIIYVPTETGLPILEAGRGVTRQAAE